MDPALTYEWVQQDLKNDPLKPNQLSKAIDRAQARYERIRQALKQLAEG